MTAFASEERQVFFKGKKERREKVPGRSSFVMFLDYSSTGAPTGQTPAQEPQEMQASASITYAVSPSLMQPTGQEPAQAPQEIQASVILYAIGKHLLSQDTDQKERKNRPWDPLAHIITYN